MTIKDFCRACGLRREEYRFILAICQYRPAQTPEFRQRLLELIAEVTDGKDPAAILDALCTDKTLTGSAMKFYSSASTLSRDTRKIISAWHRAFKGWVMVSPEDYDAIWALKKFKAGIDSGKF